jgi:hypothetical protein
MVIAVVFYASVYVAGSRHSDAEFIDAQQLIRDATLIPPLRPTPTASSSSAASSTQRPSKIRKSKQKPKTNLLINEDSDDDEPIIRPTPVSSNVID